MGIRFTLNLYWPLSPALTLDQNIAMCVNRLCFSNYYLKREEEFTKSIIKTPGFKDQLFYFHSLFWRRCVIQIRYINRRSCYVRQIL